MKFLNFFAALCFLSAVTTPQAQAQNPNVPLNIAVVDFDKVSMTATAPKSITEQVKAIRQKYHAQIQAEEAELRKANQSLAQKQSLLSSDAFKAERRKFEQEVLAVQKKVQQKNINLQNAQKDAKRKVNEALRDVILEIAKKNNFTMVLRRDQTVVVADDLDITNNVIEALDKKLPSVTISLK